MLRGVLRLSEQPVRLLALVFGWWWFVNGAVGLALSTDFSTGQLSGDHTLLAVNGWHNLAHLFAGAVGMLAALRVSTAALFAGTFSVLYVLWGAFGLASGGNVWWFYGDDPGNVLHLVEGSLLGVGLVITGCTRERRSRLA